MFCSGMKELKGYIFEVYAHTEHGKVQYFLVDTSPAPFELVSDYSSHGGLMDTEKVLYEKNADAARNLSHDAKSIYRWLTVGERATLAESDANKDLLPFLKKKS